MDVLKNKGIRNVNNLIKQVDSIKTGASSSHNELVVTCQTSYANFSKNVQNPMMLSAECNQYPVLLLEKRINLSCS